MVSGGSLEIRERIRDLKVFKRGGQRAPHKPLLLLYAFAQFLQGRRELSYESVAEALEPMLNAYAPPVTGRHEPRQPYWYLRDSLLHPMWMRLSRMILFARDSCQVR